MKQLDYMPYALAETYRYEPFNILGMAAFRGTAPVAAWQKAVEALQVRHPLLNCRLADEYRLEPVSNEELPLTIQQRRSEKHWEQAARDALNERLDLSSGPLLRFVLLQDGRQGEVILSGLHSIVDGASGLNLLHELLQNVAAAASGIALPYAKPLPELPELDDLLPLDYKRGQRLTKLLRYAAVQMADEVIVSARSVGKPAPPVQRPSQTDFFPFSIDSSLTTALAQRTRQERVTLHSVLNAAQMLAAYHHRYSSARLPFRNFVFSDLRPYLDPPLGPEQLGAYIAMQRFTHTMQDSRTLWDLAQEVQQKVYQAARSGDKFLAYVMARPLMHMFLRFKRDRMGHSALSYLGVAPFHNSYGELTLTDLRVMVSQMWLSPDISSQVCLFNDRLLWTLIYPAQDVAHEQAQLVAERILEIFSNSV